MTLTLTAADLALFLAVDDVNTPRAELMLTLAQQACSVYLAELPDAAQGLVLSIAGRAYSNPQGVSAETVGPFSVTRPPAGVYLTRADRQALKLLAGRGGAFTIDPTAPDAGTRLDPWNANVTYLEGVPGVDDQTSAP